MLKTKKEQNKPGKKITMGTTHKNSQKLKNKGP